METTVSPTLGRYIWSMLRLRRVRLWASAVLAVTTMLVIRSFWLDSGGLASPIQDIGLGCTLAVFFAAMLCEYVDSALGMGYGTTLTPLLLLAGFEPLAVVPAILLSEFVTGLSAGLLHHRDGNVDLLRDKQTRKTTLLLASLSTVGAIAAVTLAIQIPKFWLKGIIAVIIVSVGVLIIATRRRQLRYRPSHIIGLGALAAFNKGLSGGGYGPLVTGGQVISGVSARKAVAITSLAEALTCLVGLSAYVIMAGWPDWNLAIPLTLGALLSVPMATLTIRKLSESIVRSSVGIVVCILGALTMGKLVWSFI